MGRPKKPEEYDEPEEDLDSEFEEMEQEERRVPPRSSPQRQQVQPQRRPVPSMEIPQIKERYEAVYQPERIGIVDTITKEVVIEGLSDVQTAQLEAIKLNMLDRIGIASGA